jgi:hypothetical protein
VTLARLATEGAAARRLAGTGLVLEPHPGVALASVSGGRLVARFGTRRRRALVARLDLGALTTR